MRTGAAIVQRRRLEPIRTTDQLAELVKRSIPGGGRWQRIHPATRVFQALRIAVNAELSGLEALLEALPACLKAGGRAAVISFHSLEDRRVKQAFSDRTRWERLTKKPIVAGAEEIQANPRARSAKLRAARLKQEARKPERET